MSDVHEDSDESFSLKRKTPAANDRERTSLLSWQEQAYDRLKVLYDVSKLLASDASVDKAFPKILGYCSNSFPFVTGILIARRGTKTSTAMWHAANVGEDQIAKSMDNAKKSFDYLTGSSSAESTDLRSQKTSSDPLQGVSALYEETMTNERNFVVIPLIVDNLPAFGVLQLDGSSPLGEKDLEFVDALASLIAVAVDRNHRVDSERRFRDFEAHESSKKLSNSQAQVSDLETERELREKFVSLLSHDLRTPLSAAKISGQLIQRQADLSESSRSLAARIVANVVRADQMITDLLDANRIRSGEKLTLTLEHFELSALVRETLEELATIHGDRFVFKNDEHIEGYWDHRYLRRILENLCNNAIKYGQAHAPVTVVIKPSNDKVLLEIQNLGEPIPVLDQKTVFQQFRRSSKATKSRKKGWGIGLTLVRGVAEAHGGSVKLESNAEIGTVFTVLLPVDSRPFISVGENHGK